MVSGYLSSRISRPQVSSSLATLTVIAELIVEFFRIRVRRSPVGLVFVFLEPVFLIAVFSVIYIYLNRPPVYGPSQILFHANGVLPFYWFIRISTRTRNAELDRVARFPVVNPLDVFFSLVAVESLIMTVVTVMVFVTLDAFDIPMALPMEPLTCVGAIFVLVVFSAGLGLVNAVIVSYIEIWGVVMAVCSRGLMLISGVFQVLDFFPLPVRHTLAYNPVAGGVIWFRTGFYPHYPSLSLDKTYLVIWAVGLFALGVCLERATRRNRGLL